MTKKETVKDPEEEGNEEAYEKWDSLSQQQKVKFFNQKSKTFVYFL